jgi:hypothetical protein
MPRLPAERLLRDDIRSPFTPRETLTPRFEKFIAKPRPRLLRLRKKKPTPRRKHRGSRASRVVHA